MDVYGFVGPSGSGKSYRALYVAGLYSIDYIIDDGILICGNKIIAGSSAKVEKTMVGAVRCAVFLNEKKRIEMINAIKALDIKSILILGTSEKMVKRIAESLELGEFKKIISIYDIATNDEIDLALKTRATQGMHTVPLPTFAIKKEFSGILIDKLNIFLRGGAKNETFEETKAVVRPTFSYIGEFHIKENVIIDIAEYAAQKIDGVCWAPKISITNMPTGITLSVQVSLEYGRNLKAVADKIISNVTHDVEYLTSINVEKVDVNVKNIVVKD